MDCTDTDELRWFSAGVFSGVVLGAAGGAAVVLYGAVSGIYQVYWRSVLPFLIIFTLLRISGIKLDALHQLPVPCNSLLHDHLLSSIPYFPPFNWRSPSDWFERLQRWSPISEVSTHLHQLLNVVISFSLSWFRYCHIGESCSTCTV